MAEELNREELAAAPLADAETPVEPSSEENEAPEVAPVSEKPEKKAKKGAKSDKKSDAKKEKKSPAIVRFFKKIGGLFAKLGHFLKDCKSEMKKVVWYGKKQTINSSLIVLAVMLIAGAVIVLLDIGLSYLLNLLASWMPSI